MKNKIFDFFNFKKKQEKEKVKSTHVVEVVPVVLEKHPNADRLSIVKIGGYQCVVSTKDWQGVDKAAYIQPDSVVPDDKEYRFLGRAIKNDEGVIQGYEALTLRERRVTAKKFRGERSEGLLMPAPRGSKIGDNVAEKMGIVRYISAKELKEQEEEELRKNWWRRINRKGRRGLSFVGNENGPSLWVPVYDLENWYRYGERVFKEGEEVVITEKIHGCNTRFMFSSQEERMFAGSRTTWKRPMIRFPHEKLWKNLACKVGLMKPLEKPAQDEWNRVMRDFYPQIQDFCFHYKDHVLFGEIYGPGVQDLDYGLEKGQLEFAGFDVFDCKKGLWWSWQECEEFLLGGFNVPMVPLLFKGPYSKEKVRQEIDGKSFAANHWGKSQIREGCVIEAVGEGKARPAGERRILKAVSSLYLERASKEECEEMNKKRKGEGVCV